MLNKKVVAMLATEFIGTALLTLTVLAVKGSAIGIAYFIALAIGLALAGLTFLINGEWIGQFNPALSIGLWTVKKIKTLDMIFNILFQFLGAIAAGQLYSFVINNKGVTSGGKYSSHILIAEALGAFTFVLIYSVVVYKKLQGSSAAIASGIALSAGIFVASIGSNALINPAIAIGVKSFTWSTYVLGPVIGAVIAINLYSFLYTERVATARANSRVSSKSSSSSKSKK